MHSKLYLRLLKTGLILLLAYLVFAYAFTIIIIIRNELQILDATQVISAMSTVPGISSLEGQVRNVFGDPIPYAVILLGEQLVQADNTGCFQIGNLNPGRYTLEIFAGEYEKYKREIQIETGVNSPPIKYETGLWPQTFLVDFHIFYKEKDQILGIAGFANGSSKPIFIQRATLFDPRGEAVADLLHDHDGFAYYANLSSKLEVVEEPQKALKWAPRMWQSGEFPPLQGPFQPGPYTLEVHYAFEEGHNLGLYHTLQITDHLDLDANWNPHLP